MWQQDSGVQSIVFFSQAGTLLKAAARERERGRERVRVRRRESERAWDRRVRMMHKEKQSSEELVVKVAAKRAEQMVKVGSVSGLSTHKRCDHVARTHFNPTCRNLACKTLTHHPSTLLCSAVLLATCATLLQELYLKRLGLKFSNLGNVICGSKLHLVRLARRLP